MQRVFKRCQSFLGSFQSVWTNDRVDRLGISSKLVVAHRLRCFTLYVPSSPRAGRLSSVSAAAKRRNLWRYRYLPLFGVKRRRICCQQKRSAEIKLQQTVFGRDVTPPEELTTLFPKSNGIPPPLHACLGTQGRLVLLLNRYHTF